jgi:hypothetical protein
MTGRQRVLKAAWAVFAGLAVALGLGLCWAAYTDPALAAQAALLFALCR